MKKSYLLKLLSAGLLVLVGCAKPELEAGPRHDIKVVVKTKIPFSADYNWSFEALNEYKGNRETLISGGGEGGYYYETFEHNETNMGAGHILTTAGALSPANNRTGALPSSAYITMRIVVDGDVKADTTINSLMPPNSRGWREAKLRVVL